MYGTRAWEPVPALSHHLRVVKRLLRVGLEGRTLKVMATRSDMVSTKPGKHGSAVLGRSAATGRLVMTPASRRGLISVKEAKAAAKSVSGSRSKKK